MSAPIGNKSRLENGSKRGRGISVIPENDKVKHRLHEDVAAMFLGTGLVALGATFYTHAMLATGGTAGLTFLAHYVTGIGFGTLFFFINLPFYIFAALRMGWAFTVRTFLAVLLVSTFVTIFPRFISFSTLDPIFAAVAGGALMGMGLLILFRHRTSLGGVNIMALYVQDRFGWSAGYFQLASDLAVLVAALFILDWYNVVLSMLGALVLNLMIVVNHRADRYMGVS